MSDRRNGRAGSSGLEGVGGSKGGRVQRGGESQVTGAKSRWGARELQAHNFSKPRQAEVTPACRKNAADMLCYVMCYINSCYVMCYINSG